jgi:hypothetical protein
VVQTKLCRNPPTHGVYVWSPKSGKDTDSASARLLRNLRNQGRQEAASLRATNVAAALRAADLASAKTAADAAGRRPSGGAVDSPPQAVTSRMCASGSQRGLASASVKAATLVYLVATCPSPHHVSSCVSQRRLSQRVDVWWGLRALSPAVEVVRSRGGAVFRDCV